MFVRCIGMYFHSSGGFFTDKSAEARIRTLTSQYALTGGTGSPGVSQLPETDWRGSRLWCVLLKATRHLLIGEVRQDGDDPLRPHRLLHARRNDEQQDSVISTA
jgi:hypothetical protein